MTPPIPATEEANEATRDLDSLTPRQLVDLMNRENRIAVDAVDGLAGELAEAVGHVRDALLRGGRLIYVGAGTSGRLGVLDASECPPTFSADPAQVIGLIAGGERALRHAAERAEDDREAGRAALCDVNAGERDVVCGITASGTTPYVLGALDEARERGATTLLVTCNPGATSTTGVTVPLVAATGPEVLTGSTRLKAGTATKLILNALTTGGFVLSGKVYSNRMVDLRPGSSKLVNRGVRILVELLEIEEDRARSLLEASGQQVKVALLMGAAGLDRSAAESRLAGAGGFLRKALPPGVVLGGSGPR